MQIDRIQSIITPKSTGYAAAAGIGLTIISGASKNKQIKSTHKPLAWISAALTLTHIGLIEYYRHKYTSGKK